MQEIQPRCNESRAPGKRTTMGADSAVWGKQLGMFGFTERVCCMRRCHHRLSPTPRSMGNVRRALTLVASCGPVGQ